MASVRELSSTIMFVLSLFLYEMWMGGVTSWTEQPFQTQDPPKTKNWVNYYKQQMPLQLKAVNSLRWV
jgi:hypothetical protein